MKNSIFTARAYDLMSQALLKMKNSGELSVPDTSEPIIVDDEALLTFAVFGDPQVSNYMFARQRCFYSAVLDIANMPCPLDALIIAGDIAENGLKCEYLTVSRMLNEISDKVNLFICVTGNHDIRVRPYKRQLSVFRDFMSSVRNGVVPDGKRYYHSTVINGYKFIMLGADIPAFEASFIGKEQLAFIENEISSSEKGKPVFIINHQPLKKHNGLPDTWQAKGDWRGSVGLQSDKLEKMFRRYDNVFYISGHLHWCTNEKSFDDRGAYKCLSAQTVGAGNHGDFGEESQGFIVSVYEDRIIIRARLFGKGKYVDKSLPGAYTEIPLPHKNY